MAGACARERAREEEGVEVLFSVGRMLHQCAGYFKDCQWQSAGALPDRGDYGSPFQPTKFDSSAMPAAWLFSG